MLRRLSLLCAPFYRPCEALEAWSGTSKPHIRRCATLHSGLDSTDLTSQCVNSAKEQIRDFRSGNHRTCPTSSPASSKYEPLLQQGEQLLQALKAEDEAAQQKSKPESQKDIRRLLHLAVGLQQAKAPGITDQLLQIVMKKYKSLVDSDAKLEFLTVIVEDFGVQDEAVQEAVTAYQLATERQPPGQEVVWRAIKRLQAACQPRYASLFVPISNQPGGIKFLSDLRADVLTAIREAQGRPSATHLRALSDALKASLSEWFSVGLLELDELTWHSSPAALLEKAVKYEQVHEYNKQNPWKDLRQRLSGQKRLYGFFHSSMPDVPLVLLYVALMPNITSDLPQILDQTGPDSSSAQAAVFYSINSTQKGLAGIDLGNFLIKQAATRLLREHPHVKELSTLSPMPGFSRWWLTSLDQQFLPGEDANPIASQIDYSSKEAACVEDVWKQARRASPASKGPTSLAAFQTEVMSAQSCQKDEAIWKPLLEHLAARYLLLEKRRSLALDPVANFHLRNGAELWRINYKACNKGDSFGLMVNYKYNLDEITNNNQAYIHNGIIKAAPSVLELASRWQ